MDGSNVVILVADDEELVRNMIAVVVRKDGYHVLIASDGVEALDLSRRYDGRIDLLISDVEMSRMNGVDLASRVARERPGIKVILVSANNPDLEIPQTFKFLGKPFGAKAMRGLISDLLTGTE